MPLCDTCNRISVSLLSFTYDHKYPYDSRDSIYEHQSLPNIKESANAGCDLCKVLIHNIRLIEDGRLDETEKLKLKHSRRSLNGKTLPLGIGLRLQNNFVGNVSYYVVPPEWCDILSDSGQASSKAEEPVERKWLSDCLTGHPACVAEKSHFRPTRLLDLSAFHDSPDLVLVETANLPSENLSYLTLSHCWGTNKERPATTTFSNLSERSRTICYAEMPLTFQDAIDITRNIKKRYLWIDSLCIVQDSLEDWQNESSKMGDIYANSFCTLAASSSSDSQGGCRLRNREFNLPQNIPYIDITANSQRLRFFKTPFPIDWQTEYLAGPLRKRAWALQERELSQRVLHYAQSVLLWQCKTSRFCGDLPWIDLDAPRMSEKSGGLGIQGASANRDRWFSIVQDYSERFLTVETDKLPALSGLAHKDLSLHGQYYVGIREQDLPHALIWRTKSLLWSEAKPYRPARYRAPSWSWASIEGCITYEDTVGLLDAGNIPSNRPDPPPFTISKIILETNGNDRMGQVLGGHMTVRGCLKQAVMQEYKHWQDNKFYSGGWRKIFDGAGNPVGCIAPDIFPQPDFDTNVFCLAIATTRKSFSEAMPHALYGRRANEEESDNMTEGVKSEDVIVNSEDVIEVIGLALAKVDDQPNTYARIGLIRWMRQSWFKDTLPIELNII